LVAPDEGEIQGQLESALGWAATGEPGVPGAKGEDGVQQLVIVAGSLYLVADFYRLLAKQSDSSG